MEREPVNTYQTNVRSNSPSSIAWLEQNLEEKTLCLPVKAAIEVTKDANNIVCISVYTLLYVSSKAEKQKKNTLVAMNELAMELSAGVYYKTIRGSEGVCLRCLRCRHTERDVFIDTQEGNICIYSCNKQKLEDVHNEVKNRMYYTNKLFLHDIPLPQSQLEAELRGLSLCNVFAVHGYCSMKAIALEYYASETKKKRKDHVWVTLYSYEIMVYSKEDEDKIMNTISMTLPVVGKCTTFRPYLRSEFILHLPLFTTELQQWALMTYGGVERETFEKIIIENDFLNGPDLVCVTSLQEPVSDEQIAKLQLLKFGKVSHVTANTLRYIMTQLWTDTVCEGGFKTDVHENMEKNTCTAIIISTNQLVIDQFVERVERAKRMLTSVTINVPLFSEHLQKWATDIWQKVLPVSVVDFIPMEEEDSKVAVTLYVYGKIKQRRIQQTCNRILLERITLSVVQKDITHFQ